jgi:hypothetical protein
MKKLYIDDIRNPKGKGFDIVRNSKEAIDFLNSNGCPEYISFDHDLGGHDTSMVIVKFLIEKDLDSIEDNNEIFIPMSFKFNVHSANPVGAANIEGYLNSYLNTRKLNYDF